MILLPWESPSLARFSRIANKVKFTHSIVYPVNTMSDKPTTPEMSVEPVTVELMPEAPSNRKPTPKFISAHDLPDIIRILVNCDKITPDVAIQRLNNMVERGSIVIVPLIGTKRRA